MRRGEKRETERENETEREKEKRESTKETGTEREKGRKDTEREKTIRKRRRTGRRKPMHGLCEHHKAPGHNSGHPFALFHFVFNSSQFHCQASPARNGAAWRTKNAERRARTLAIPPVNR